eukprot:6188407-Pleurochrysis_carterae.AAC.2
MGPALHFRRAGDEGSRPLCSRGNQANGSVLEAHRRTSVEAWTRFVNLSGEDWASGGRGGEGAAGATSSKK